MYPLVLSLHSILRWAVVIVAVVAIVRAFIGWFGKKPWQQADDQLGLVFVTLMDLQLLIGLLLYFFLSPITTGALRNFGDAMSNSGTRYFAVEHILMMIIAVILAHAGRSMSKKAEDDTGKHKRAAIFFALAFLIMLASIPWPFLEAGAGRPWLRLG